MSFGRVSRRAGAFDYTFGIVLLCIIAIIVMVVWLGRLSDKRKSLVNAYNQDQRVRQHLSTPGSRGHEAYFAYANLEREFRDVCWATSPFALAPDSEGSALRDLTIQRDKLLLELKEAGVTYKEEPRWICSVERRYLQYPTVRITGPGFTGAADLPAAQ